MTPQGAGPRRRLHRQPGDGWLECSCGSRHWGLHGAAGLLVARPGADGTPTAVVLQHRAPWSDGGDTWGIPGGALAPGEGAVAGALREAREEAGIEPADVLTTGTHVLDHGTWSYTTVLALAVRSFEPYAADDESLSAAWIPLDEVPGLPLLPAFAAAWPALRATLDEPPVPGTSLR